MQSNQAATLECWHALRAAVHFYSPRVFWCRSCKGYHYISSSDAPQHPVVPCRVLTAGCGLNRKPEDLQNTSKWFQRPHANSGSPCIVSDGYRNLDLPDCSGRSAAKPVWHKNRCRKLSSFHHKVVGTFWTGSTSLFMPTSKDTLFLGRIRFLRSKHGD